jgi:multidrug resistance efflux pump
MDENVESLTRRFYDLELELTSCRDQLAQAQKDNRELRTQLGGIGRETAKKVAEVEEELNHQIAKKERELVRAREELERREAEWRAEQEREKQVHRGQIDVIQDKVEQALAKKRTTIDQLVEELKLKDLQVQKLKALLDKQRNELLK